MRYTTLNGGKRVRPLLAFAAGELTAAPAERLEIVASVVELIHSYSPVSYTHLDVYKRQGAAWSDVLVREQRGTRRNRRQSRQRGVGPAPCRRLAGGAGRLKQSLYCNSAADA